MALYINGQKVDGGTNLYANNISISPSDSDTIAEKLDDKVDTSDFLATNLPIQSGSATNTKDYIDSVVESGSNTNGNYIKYKDGSMICTKTASVEVLNTAWSDWGALKEVTSLSLGDFAETFYQAPIVSLSLSGDAAWLERISGTTVSSIGTISILRPNSPGRTTNYSVSVMAIGRWKA